LAELSGFSADRKERLVGVVRLSLNDL